MKFNVTEVAKFIHVKKDLIKTWAYHFSDYLNPLANPKKGVPRKFIPSDLSVLLYIAYYWENDPGIEDIKSGLNLGEHHNNFFNKIIDEVMPFFMEPPEELNEGWRHGALRGAFGNYVDRFSLAEEYKLAGDILVGAAIRNDQVYEVVAPIVYNYRHSIELYLKYILDSTEEIHDLYKLFLQFKKLILKEFQTTIPTWFEDLVLSFHKFDPGGTSFRYEGIDPFCKESETWVDMRLLQRKMEWLSEGFKKVKYALENR